MDYQDTRGYDQQDKQPINRNETITTKKTMKQTMRDTEVELQKSKLQKWYNEDMGDKVVIQDDDEDNQNTSNLRYRKQPIITKGTLQSNIRKGKEPIGKGTKLDSLPQSIKLNTKSTINRRHQNETISNQSKNPSQSKQPFSDSGSISKSILPNLQLDNIKQRIRQNDQFDDSPTLKSNKQDKYQYKQEELKTMQAKTSLKQAKAQYAREQNIMKRKKKGGSDEEDSGAEDDDDDNPFSSNAIYDLSSFLYKGEQPWQFDSNQGGHNEKEDDEEEGNSEESDERDNSNKEPQEKDTPCLCSFLYSMDHYNESKIFPLTDYSDDKKDILYCSHIHCHMPAYFLCNRNLCGPAASCKRDQPECKHNIRKKKLNLWEGCGQAFCWLHFKFEHFIDRDILLKKKQLQIGIAKKAHAVIHDK